MFNFDLDANTFFGFTGGAALLAIIFIILIYLWAQDINRFKKFIAFWGWLFSGIWRGATYVAAKNEIEGKLNSFIGNLESKTGERFPRISIAWTGDGKNESMVWEDLRAIIVIRDRKSRNKNFVHAAYYFISNALLREAKIHLAKTQSMALDLFTTKRILEEENNYALQQFMSDYFVPETIERPKIKELVKSFIKADRLGIFFPILIKELSYLGRKIFLEDKNENIVGEVGSLINFLDEYSQRQVGDTTIPTNFRGEYSRCAIRIIASKDRRCLENVGEQATFILGAARDGAENIYVIGSGEKENEAFVSLVQKEILKQNSGLLCICKLNFPAFLNFDTGFKKVRSCLVHFHNPEVADYLIYKTKISKV